MKKKLICIFLFVAMALGTLSGCGKEETKVETENNDVLVEVEKETTTNKEETTNTPIVKDERPELAKVGKTTYMDWGSYTIVDSANGLDDVEVEFYEMTFKATVPQDMGATSEWDEKSLLKLYNKDKSKLLMAWYVPITMDDKAKDDTFTEEEWRSFLVGSYSKDGYSFEKNWITDDILEVSFETNTANTKGQEEYGYAVFKMDFAKGFCYQFYYCENLDICNANVVKTVANSFDFLDAEDLTAHTNGVVDLENTGNMSSEYITSYGLTEGALVFPNDTNIVENDNMLTTNTNGVSLEKANEIVNTFINTIEVYDISGTKITGPIDSISYWEGYYKSGDNWNQIAVMFSATDDTGNLSVCIRKNYPINF